MNVQNELIEKILVHVNGDITEQELVTWAEEMLIDVIESDIDIPNEDVLIDILTYLAAADAPGFPLSWSLLRDFLARLGTRVHVTTSALTV